MGKITTKEVIDAKEKFSVGSVCHMAELLIDNSGNLKNCQNLRETQGNLNFCGKTWKTQGK